MSNLCIQVEDYVSPFAGQLPVIQTEDLIYIEKYETDAYGHWVFGGNSSSLIDKVNSSLLAVQAGATIQPAYFNNYLTLSNIVGNALVSSIVDSAVNSFTLSTVVQAGDTALTILAGALARTTDPKGGSGVFASNSKIYATAREGVSSVDIGMTLDMNKPVFVSLSIDKVNLSVNFVAMQNGVTFETTRALSSYVAADATLGFGNVRFTASGSSVATSNYYEAIIHTKALTIDEMKAVAMRAKTRQEKRGIVF